MIKREDGPPGHKRCPHCKRWLTLDCKNWTKGVIAGGPGAKYAYCKHCSAARRDAYTFNVVDNSILKCFSCTRTVPKVACEDWSKVGGRDQCPDCWYKDYDKKHDLKIERVMVSGDVNKLWDRARRIESAQQKIMGDADKD